MPNDPTSGFDIDAARQAGYSDDEILQHLAGTRNFDVNSAIQSGYSKQDVINYLATPKSSGQTPGASQITGISAQPASTGWLNDVENTLKDAGNDVRYGTGTTQLGRFLQSLGSPGTTSGVSQSVSDFMGGPVLGPLRAAQGAAEIPQSGKGWQGTKDLVGGALQAAQIPAAFMGGPATEGGATVAGRATSQLFGDTQKAGQLFDAVRAATADQPIELSDDVYDALNNVKQLADAGAKGTPRVASKLANRLNNVDEELYWDEARRFYSNISRLSVNEYNNMAPQMQRAVGQLGRALGDTLQSAADSAGVGDQYQQAMQLYARSKSWQQFGSDAWQFVKKAAPYATGVGVGGRMAISHFLGE